MEDIEKLWGVARSLPDAPRGKYIGAIQKGNTVFFLYRDGPEVFYETDYDRRRRKELRHGSRSLH